MKEIAKIMNITSFGRVNCGCFSSSDRLLALVCAEELVVFECLRWKKVATLDLDVQEPKIISFTPSDSAVIVAETDTSIVVVETTGWTLRR